MATCSEIVHATDAEVPEAPEAPEVPWVQRALRRLTAAWRAYWERRARQATVALLQSLDAQTLRDIGIDRSEIESVVYGPPRERRHRLIRVWE